MNFYDYADEVVAMLNGSLKQSTMCINVQEGHDKEIQLLINTNKGTEAFKKIIDIFQLRPQEATSLARTMGLADAFVSVGIPVRLTTSEFYNLLVWGGYTYHFDLADRTEKESTNIMLNCRNLTLRGELRPDTTYTHNYFVVTHSSESDELRELILKVGKDVAKLNVPQLEFVKEYLDCDGKTAELYNKISTEEGLKAYRAELANKKLNADKDKWLKNFQWPTDKYALYAARLRMGSKNELASNLFGNRVVKDFTTLYDGKLGAYSDAFPLKDVMHGDRNLKKAILSNFPELKSKDLIVRVLNNDENLILIQSLLNYKNVFVEKSELQKVGIL